jgi:CubicO group peptidase (beta-lactamase class C family)
MKTNKILNKCLMIGAMLFTIYAPRMAADEPANISNLGLDPAQSDKIAKLVKDGMQTWHSPGLAVGIVKDSKLVWSGYFGYSNIEKKQAVADTTIFRIGSISKTMTAVAMMQLSEDGKFQVDDPVDYYAPHPIYHQKYSCCPKVTFMNIFTHTSGGGEYRSLGLAFEHLFLKPGKSRRSLENLFKRGIHTRICPEDKWAYCNYCVASLGLILENITGESFEDYTNAHIFKPLGMTSSGFYEKDISISNLAQGYDFKNGQWKPADPVVIEAVPAGNAYSTVNDISRYMIALLDNGKIKDFILLKPETVKDMLAVHYQLDPRLPGMGISFMLRDSFFGHRVAGHPGGIPGFTAQMTLAPDDKLGVVVLNNAGTGAPSEIAAGILRILFDYSEPKRNFATAKNLWPKLAGAYVSPEFDWLTDAGFFRSTRGAYQIRIKKDELRMETNKHGESYVLQQVSPDDPYFYEIIVKDNLISQFLVFKPGADGKAESLIIGMNEYVRKGSANKKKPCE